MKVEAIISNKVKVISFDMDELVNNAKESSRMAGFAYPEKIDLLKDSVEGVITESEDKVFFAIAYKEQAENLTKGDSIEKLIADIWKNTIIDEAYCIMHDKFENESRRAGKYISSLYGPGYYEMPITDTILVCEYANADKIGIECNENGCMEPAFSRCGFFVLSDTVESGKINSCISCKGNVNGCSMCILFSSND